MKKKTVIICLTIFFFFLGIYAAYDAAFPKAARLNYPDYSQVESIKVSHNGEPIHLSENELETIYEYIRDAVPTRKMSPNETPDISPYYSVHIESDALSEFASIFSYGNIYELRGVYYFEIPYVGVYRLRV